MALPRPVFGINRPSMLLSHYLNHQSQLEPQSEPEGSVETPETTKQFVPRPDKTSVEKPGDSFGRFEKAAKKMPSVPKVEIDKREAEDERNAQG